MSNGPIEKRTIGSACRLPRVSRLTYRTPFACQGCSLLLERHSRQSQFRIFHMKVPNIKCLKKKKDRPLGHVCVRLTADHVLLAAWRSAGRLNSRDRSGRQENCRHSYPSESILLVLDCACARRDGPFDGRAEPQIGRLHEDVTWRVRPRSAAAHFTTETCLANAYLVHVSTLLKLQRWCFVLQ